MKEYCQNGQSDGPLAPLKFDGPLALGGACAWDGCEVGTMLAAEVDASYLSVWKDCS